MSDRRNYNPRQKPNDQQPSNEAVEKIDAKDLKEAIGKLDQTYKREVGQVYEGPIDGSIPPNKIANDINNIRNIGILDMNKKEDTAPVYNVSRDQETRRVVLNSQDKEESSIETISPKEDIMVEMFNTLEKEILKTMVEIEICEVLDKDLFHDGDKHLINYRRLESFKNNLEYLNVKKDILHKMIKG